MKFLAFDTETHRFGLANMAPRIVCVSLYDGNTARLTKLREGAEALDRAMTEALAGGPALVGHNVAYDMACVLSSMPELAPKIWQCYDKGVVQCTLLREQLLDIANGQLRFEFDAAGEIRKVDYGLADIYKRRFAKILEKPDDIRLNYADLEGTPLAQWPKAAREYALNDARATWEIAQAQSQQAREASYELFENEAARQASYYFALQLSTCWGLEADRERAEELRRALTLKQVEYIAQLKEARLIRPKGSKDMKAVRQMIVSLWPGGTPPKTEKGAIKTGREVLEACAVTSGVGEQHPLKVLVNYNRAEKVLSTYVELLCKDGLVHPSYGIAATGRTTCRKPNIQNQPKNVPGSPLGVRECFRARKGHVLISVDYDSQELRALAQVLLEIVGQSTLAERYRKDPSYDPHTDFAARLLGMTYREAMTKKKSDARVKDMRQRSKGANFGYPGGMGAKKFVLYARGYGLNMSEAESAELRDRWFEQWPEMKRYFDHVSQMSANGTGTLVQLYSGRRRGNCGFSDGANSYFQGLAADISKLAMYEVTRACYADPASPLYGCRVVAFIHDEIILEAPIEYGHEAAEELVRVMIECMEKYTPDVPAKASPAMMYHWTKEADEIRDAHGKLIPWEDRPNERST